jgi:hypothetical protein
VDAHFYRLIEGKANDREAETGQHRAFSLVRTMLGHDVTTLVESLEEDVAYLSDVGKYYTEQIRMRPQGDRTQQGLTRGLTTVMPREMVRDRFGSPQTAFARVVVCVIIRIIPFSANHLVYCVPHACCRAYSQFCA